MERALSPEYATINNNQAYCLIYIYILGIIGVHYVGYVINSSTYFSQLGDRRS